MTDPHRPYVGVGCIIERDGKLLLMCRHGSHGQGTWSTPGGYLESGESFEDCAARETLEETGLVVTDISYFGVTQRHLPGGEQALRDDMDESRNRNRRTDRLRRIDRDRLVRP